MNLNYSFGSCCDVLISDVNQVPYTILREVETQVEFVSFSKTATARANKLSYTDTVPSTVTIKNVQPTTKILDMLFEKDNSKSTLFNTQNARVNESGKLLLNKQKAKNINIFLEDWTFLKKVDSSENGTITEIPAGRYNVIYEYEIESETYKARRSPSKYYTLFINGVGNSEEQTSKVSLKLKAALSPEMSFSFENSHINSFDLVFTVLDDDINTIGFSK